MAGRIVRRGRGTPPDGDGDKPDRAGRTAADGERATPGRTAAAAGCSAAAAPVLSDPLARGTIGSTNHLSVCAGPTET